MEHIKIKFIFNVKKSMEFLYWRNILNQKLSKNQRKKTKKQKRRKKKNILKEIKIQRNNHQHSLVKQENQKFQRITENKKRKK